MTKTEILEKVQKGELTATEATKLFEKAEKKPPIFKVATKSGWCSVYLHGMRYPCTLPADVWLELLEPENIDRLKAFIKANSHLFKNKG
jgi:hypothetical protein